jgi:HD-like signal output (HDOD) protein
LTTIVSLEQAVTRLGTQRCAGLILALAVIKVFVPRSEAQRNLWIHSLQTALFARMFCQRIPSVKSNPGQAYLCGVLHDIGRFVQFEGAPADLTRVDDMHWASPQELIDAELSALGYDHSLLGWRACNKWSLPAAVGEVVRCTHWSSRRGPLLARAPLRTGHASWPRIRLKHEGSPIFMEPEPGDRTQKPV